MGKSARGTAAEVGRIGEKVTLKVKVKVKVVLLTNLIIVVVSTLSAALHSSSGDLGPSTGVPPAANTSSSAIGRIYLGCGMSGKVRCPLRATPPDVVIVWLKDDRPMDLVSGVQMTRRVRMDKRGNLVIRAVMTADQGFYQCSTYSPMAASSRSPTVQVLVRDPPHFTVRPRAIYQAMPGQTITMPCVASGDPTPAIIWNKVLGQFPSVQRRDQEEGNMTLARLTPTDSGAYECIAFNAVASVVTTTMLLVETQNSHGPTNLTVDPSSTFALLSWLPAYDSDLQQRYIIWYRDVTDEAWQTIDVEPAYVTSVTLHGLTPNTSYQFMVMSRDQEGRELFSSTFSAETKPAGHVTDERHHVTTSRSETKLEDYPSENSAPPSVFPPTRIPERPHPPSDILVTSAKGGLQLSWSHPHRSPVPAQYFVVEYRTVGQWVPLTGKTSAMTFLWTTASRGAEYQFRVISYAADRMTSSEPSEPVTFDTEESQGTVRFGDGAMVGLVSGLLLVIITAAFIYVIVRILRRRRSRRTDSRYQNVKYFGPNHHANATDKNEAHDDDNIFDPNQIATNCVSTNIAQQEFCDKSRDEVTMTEVVEAEATV